MEKFNNIYELYFRENIYKDNMGDYKIILDDFLIFINNLSITDKIKLCCINNKLNKNDLLSINDTTTEQTLKTTLSRLNKNLDLKIYKNNGLNYYKTTAKGKKKIDLEKINFIKSNKYICIHEDKNKLSDQKELIKIINHFYTDYFKSELRNIMDNDLTFFEIDFEDIASYNLDLMDFIEDKPRDCISLLEVVLNNLISTDKSKNIKVGLKNLPNTFHLPIGDHRVENLDNLYEFEGIIKRKTDINPRLTGLEYLCTNPDCAYSTERLRLPQIDDKKSTLKACPRCKAPVDIVNEILIDNMFMILEEDYSTSTKTDSNLSKINLMVQGELVKPLKEKNYKPGDKVKVVGFLEKKTISSRGGSDSINYQTYVDVNNIIAAENNTNLSLSDEDIKEIKKFSEQENTFQILLQNFVSEIKGYEDIKSSMMLQLVGANSNQSNQRNDTHILLVGEPGVAKTKLAEYYSHYAPKVVYTSGTNTSKAGLTGACIKDEFTGDWAVEAGSLPKANGGIAIIDELDKMGKEDSQVMHDALESQFVPIRKAIHIDLVCKCGVFACANPKYGYFDSSKDSVSQIDLVPSLLNRFDLIYILKDEVNKTKDTEIYNHIIDSWNGENNSNLSEELNIDFIKKYFYYCKFYNKPIISKEARSKIIEFTQSLREKSKDTNFKFNARQLNGIIRLSLAHAKLLFKKQVDINSVEFALNLYTNCLNGLGADFYNQLNIAMHNLTEKSVLDMILLNDGISSLDIKKGLPDVSIEEVERVINILKIKGDIYEPRKGEWRGLHK